MKRRFEAELTSKSIDKLISQIQAYERKIPIAIKNAIESLTKIGIQTIKQNTGEYSKYIFVKSNIKQTVDGGYESLIIVYDHAIVRKWYTAKEGAKNRKIHEEEIRPLLMAEFGSGWLADTTNWSIGGVGQGTLNKYGHATDSDGWYWIDRNNQKHHSVGELPTYPVYKSFVRMESAIVSEFKKAFSNI